MCAGTGNVVDGGGTKFRGRPTDKEPVGGETVLGAGGTGAHWSPLCEP